MRALVYVPLVLVALLVLGMRPDAPAAAPPVHTLDGETSQGGPLLLRLAEDRGAVVSLTTFLRLQCSTGGAYELAWRASDDDDVRFERRGDVVRVTDRRELATADGPQIVGLDLVGTVVGRRSARGRIKGVVGFARNGRHVRTCWVAGVEWHADDT
jgi:hypothetical protein